MVEDIVYDLSPTVRVTFRIEIGKVACGQAAVLVVHAED